MKIKRIFGLSESHMQKMGAMNLQLYIKLHQILDVFWVMHCTRIYFADNLTTCLTFLFHQVVRQMPTIASNKQPTIAIITAHYAEKLAVDTMIENQETFVRYTTVGKKFANSNR